MRSRIFLSLVVLAVFAGGFAANPARASTTVLAIVMTLRWAPRPAARSVG